MKSRINNYPDIKKESITDKRASEFRNEPPRHFNFQQDKAITLFNVSNTTGRPSSIDGRSLEEDFQ